MPPQLVAITDGPNILLDKPIVLIGRHQECDIQIPSRKVSRRHCCIAQVSDHLVVRDLASTNGIRINGVRVLEGTLKAGDELTIGSYKYQLTWPSHHQGAGQQGDLPRLIAIEDQDGLDSCEEPVPLPEPKAVPGKNSFPPLLPVIHAHPPTLKKDPDLAPRSPEMPSLGIPEEMPLRPISDPKIVPPVKLNP
jgi:predicted component of type VI protein secretion system